MFNANSEIFIIYVNIRKQKKNTYKLYQKG